MNILIIDNSTKHLQELKNVFSQYGIVSVVKNKNVHANADYGNYGLIVLSGGSHCDPIHNHEQTYSNQIELIRSVAVPIVGICLGAELIACAFGGTLRDLGHKVSSTTSLESDNPQFEKAKVAERHRRSIDCLGPELEPLAESLYGYEIIKHKIKPIYGLQFHPEIETNRQQGDEILKIILTNIIKSY